MRDLRDTSNCYWFLRQLKNRAAKEASSSLAASIVNSRYKSLISNIGHAIMRVRAKEITEKAA